jgi:prepilin peptidase CpaA
MMGLSHATAWLLSVVLVEAAVIDGRRLRVPNWLTYHLALGGVAYAAWSWGTAGLLWSLAGMAAGLALLLPLYAIGGMGAGDVKLLAAVGAWAGAAVVFGSFVLSAVVGAVIALGMVAWSGQLAHHWAMFRTISQEIAVIRDPAELSRIAAQRKPTMLLLPYGIPITIGTISYFAWMGLLF